MNSNVTENTKKILRTVKKTALSFFEIYDDLEDKEEDKKQELLRAIILFSCSGIDAVVKQLINDSLENVINIDEGSDIMFKQFVEKKLRENNDKYNSKLLSEIFTSDSKPKDTLIEVLKMELTKKSLQSAEELSKVASYFDIKTTNISEIKEVFIARNQITHEMDINMQSKTLTRRTRKKEDVEKYYNTITNLAERYIKEVDKKIKIKKR